MIRQISSSMTKWLIRHVTIDTEDYELYQYAINSLIMSVAPLILTMIIGALMGKILQGVIFSIPFICIRKFSGGYHAKKEWICIVSSCLLVAFSLLVLSYIKCNWLFHIITCGFSLLLMAVSPVDSQARMLDDLEKKQYKKITIYITLFFLASYVILINLQQQRIAVYLAGGIIQTSLLQIPCIMHLIYYQTIKK